MNIFLFIIVGALVLEYGLERISNILNLKNQNHKLPDEFKNYYDDEKFLLSKQYIRATTNFQHISSTFNILLMLSIIFLGLLNDLDVIIRGYNFSPIVSGLFFWGCLFIIQDIIQTPFSMFHTFIIEGKFGFNNMTIKTYIIDKIKSYLLLIVFGGGFLFLILYFFYHFGDFAWIYAWIVLSVLLILIQPIFTLFIAPLFNSFVPLQDGPLKEKLESFLISIDFPINKIDVMDGSKRSTKSNAYFSGIGKSKRIALFDNLIDNHTDDELVSIVAHEVGHYKKGHIKKNILFSVIHLGLLMFSLSLFLNNELLFNAFKMQHLSIYASLLFFSILYSPIELLFSVLFNYISRKYEYEADTFAANAIGSPTHLITGLKKLSVNNLNHLTPHPLSVFLYYSHPPVINRIRNLEL